MDNHVKHSEASFERANAATGPSPYGVILCPCGDRAHDRPYRPDFTDRPYPTPEGD